MLALPTNSTICFLLSTFGDGEPPDDAWAFYEELQTKGLVTLFHGTFPPFSIFGLGSRSYRHFNVFATFVYEKLVHLGATPILPIVLGDNSMG